VPERIDWGHVLEEAAGIVRSYSTSVTLRQLYYRLVSQQLLPNVLSAYKGLSARTAEARRQGQFPPLIDRGRAIHRYATDTSPADALDDLATTYRRNRTEGQKFAIYLAVEKNGLVNQLTAWFGDLGVPILACGGYSSQSYVDVIAYDVARDKRPAVLLFAGDYDPSGEDIDRDLEERTACWHDVIRVALTEEQVVEYGLPPNPGKATDSRAAGFIARHGELVQVEVDALDPNDLRDLFQRSIDEFWDASTYEAVMTRESRERDALSDLADRFRDEDWDEEDDE
jgi:hypothetical protein